MSSVLVPIAEMLAVLGDVSPQDTPAIAYLTQLVDDVETLFLGACGRAERPFGAIELAKVEDFDGVGRATLFLERRISVLTSVTLGYDVALPELELDVADQTVLNWKVGSARLVRLDGHFGCTWQPNFVHVTYDAADELPRDAALAITRVVASIWRRRGSEDVTAERVGPYDATFVATAEAEPLWQMAVRAHRRIHV